MMRYSSPFGISTQMSKTTVKLPFNAPRKSLDVWVPPDKKKKMQNSVLSASSKLFQSKLSITNLTVDSTSFAANDSKSEKKREKKDANHKLKVVWHIKRRQSIIRREDTKRKANLNRCFSLKSKQATIHSVHPPQQVRFSVNSWNQTYIDRAIQNLTVELKQLFNLRHFKKKQNIKTQQNNEQKANLSKTAYMNVKHIDAIRKTSYNNDKSMSKKEKDMRKRQLKKDEQWLPWNEHWLSRNIKQNEKDIMAEWYDRNFSISLG